MYKQKNISKLRNKAAQLSYALSYDFFQETDNILQNSLRQKQAKWRYKKAGKGKEFMRTLKGLPGNWMRNVLHPLNVKPWTETGKNRLTKKEWAKFLDSMGKAKGQDLSKYKSSRPMTFPYEIEHAGGDGWLRKGINHPMAIPGTLGAMGVTGAAGLGNLWGSWGKGDMRNSINDLSNKNTDLSNQLSNLQNQPTPSPDMLSYLKDPRTLGLLGGGGLLAALALMGRGGNKSY